MSWFETLSFGENSRWMLLFLVVVPLIWWRVYLRRRPVGVRFSSVEGLGALGTSWRIRARWLLPILRTAALVLLIVALARPRKGNEQTRIRAEGIAISMLVDRSGSMQAMDFRVDDQRVDRLEAVRHVVRDFVLGDEGLPGRPDDLIGLIVFGTFADGKCPLTLDHGYLLEALDKTEIATTQGEGQTAIGDAIALGVERLQALDRDRDRLKKGKIPSKIMILLTDGESNAGDVEPLKAAELAGSFGIKIYTIGAGTQGMAPIPMQDPFTGRQILRSVPVNIDEGTLREIAKKTGGKYFRATDTDSLRNVYAEIDKLEKTETIEKRFFQYKDLATQSAKLGRFTLPPLLWCVFLLLSVEMLLSHTILRRIP